MSATGVFVNLGHLSFVLFGQADGSVSKLYVLGHKTGKFVPLLQG